MTPKILCDFFRQSGAIDRVQICGERLKFVDILKPGTSAGFVDQPPDRRKYYAYVTFVNTLGATEALKKSRYMVQEREIEIEPAFAWNQPSTALQSYLAENQRPISTATEQLYRQIDTRLNDDCIYHIMTYLNIFDLVEMAKYSQRFKTIALQVRTLNICRRNESPITLMEMRNILRLLGLGNTVTNLTVSIKTFYTQSQRYICDRLFQYVGPQLRYLTLDSFGVTTEQFELMKPLLGHLKYLDIDFNYNFDYHKFNHTWSNLEVLRIRSSGYMDSLFDNLEPKPEFPKLKKLMIANTYRLHERLIERIRRGFTNITELVIIGVDDYYSEMTQMTARNLDIENLTNFKNLTRLHLSINRLYMKDTIITIICDLNKLEHLTLDLTNVRQQDDVVWFNRINQHLPKLGVYLLNLKEIRLSGFPLNEDSLIEFIRCANNLESLCINECNLDLKERFIHSVAGIRRDFYCKHHRLISLNIIFSEYRNEYNSTKAEIDAVSCVYFFKYFKQILNILFSLIPSSFK